MTKLQGGCHCGAVRFTLSATPTATVYQCNCSICAMTGFVHLIIPQTELSIERGAEQLSEYRFGKKIAKHQFCCRCGIKSFYVPRSNPDCYSVNVNCLDAGANTDFTVAQFDGQNWEESAAELEHLSAKNS